MRRAISLALLAALIAAALVQSSPRADADSALNSCCYTYISTSVSAGRAPPGTWITQPITFTTGGSFSYSFSRTTASVYDMTTGAQLWNSGGSVRIPRGATYTFYAGYSLPYKPLGTHVLRAFIWSRVSAIPYPGPTGTPTSSGTNDGFADAYLNIDPKAPPPPPSAPRAKPGQTYGKPGTGKFGKNPTAQRSDPVNTADGSFYHSMVDAELPGIGMPFVVERTYNSADASMSPLGLGWTHSFNVSLSFDSEGSALFRGDDGYQLFFAYLGGDLFAPPEGSLASLSGLADGFLLTTSSQERYRFDAAGRLLEIRDRSDSTFALSYDGGGRLTAITDTAGRFIRFESDGLGRLSGLHLPDGRSTLYAYDGNGRLAAVTDPRGAITRYAYDAAGKLADITDANGHRVVHNEYGSNGRVVSQTDAVGEISRFSWNPDSQTSTLTDANGHAWRDVYKDNVLVDQIDPLGNSTKFEHDIQLNLTAKIDPRGGRTMMTYDARGNLLTIVGPPPSSVSESFAYDSLNNLVRSTDGKGSPTTYSYDASGNLTGLTRADGSASSFERSPNGLLLASTDAQGNRTSFEHDSLGNLVGVIESTGDKTTFAYDSASRVIAKTDPRGNVPGANPSAYTWRMTFDAADNLVSETDPLGGTTTYVYDPATNLKTRTSAKGQVVAYGYDPANHLVSVTAPDLTQTTYGYDGAGNLTSRTDALGRRTAYVYNGAGQLSETISPLGRKWAYAYDPNANIIKVTDAIGNSTTAEGDGVSTFAYDERNQLVATSYSDGLTPSVQLTYDANGNRTSMTDGLGVQTYSYDNLNRLTGVGRGSESYSYVYDTLDRIAKRTYPNGTEFDYVYDSASRLKTLTSENKTTSYSYDPAGNLMERSLPNGITERRAYDRARRLTEIASTKDEKEILAHRYTHDAVGNPLRVTTDKGEIAYQYDALDRLIEETCTTATCLAAGSPFIRYAYDAVGNRLSETRLTGTKTYSYNSDDQIVSAVSGPTGLLSTAYEHDANGNLVKQGNATFAYDQASRLIDATLADGTVAYQYDGDGNRSTQSLRKALGGSSARTFSWDVNNVFPDLAVETTDGNERVYRYGPAAAESITTGGNDYYYLHDHLESVVGLTDTLGELASRYEYESFGTARELNANPLTATNPMRFAGEYLDDVTGLYNLRARQYDPKSGRFLQKDPVTPGIRDPYVSSYVYGHNRPSAFVDPGGMWPSRAKVRSWASSTKRVADGVALVAGGAALAFGVATLVCPVCAPVTGPIAGALSTASLAATGVSLAAGMVVAGIDCLHGTNSQACINSSTDLLLSGVSVLAAHQLRLAIGRQLNGPLKGALRQFSSFLIELGAQAASPGNRKGRPRK